MSPNVNIGYGITFGIWNGSSYTSVAEVHEATPPQLSRDAIEATHHGSPNGYREYIPGLKDGGESTIGINYIPSAADPLIAAFNASTPGQFRITMPNGATCTFTAVVTAFAPETPREGKMVATMTFKVSGQPVWAQ